MSRRYRPEPIEVVVDRDGAPAGFRWRGRRYVVHAVEATWVEALPWWAGESRIPRASGQRPAQRQVWRVDAAPRTGTTGVYDLYRITGSDCWVLARVID